MKKLCLATVLLLPLFVVAQVGKITVQVVDFDGGAVIGNADVIAQFSTMPGEGEGWGGGRPNTEIGYTDTNGVCTITGGGNGASVSVAVRKEGYYNGQGGSVFFTNIVGVVRKKWQPWNPTVDVHLKKIGNPIALYAKRFRDDNPPKNKGPVGFDLVIGDWVSPYGKGSKSDFSIQIDTTSRTIKVKPVGKHGTDVRTLYDTRVSVDCVYDGDGFLTVPSLPSQSRSQLRMGRYAPEDGYVFPVTKRHYILEDSRGSNLGGGMGYFFRVRTVKDDAGSVVSALYGKIHGDFWFDYKGDDFAFLYYLNPTPNDRNLEFDTENNLFKNLSDHEKVRQP